MNPVSQVIVVIGVGIILLAAIGLMKLKTPYARIHAAGKASPVAFLVIAIGVIPEVGWRGGAEMVLACVALVITLPIGVHLLFRAVHVARPEHDPQLDELRAASRRSESASDT
ncbi:MAG: monovalent cation/H(+) antiporter subunit G [Actinomycetota bacterium]